VTRRLLGAVVLLGAASAVLTPLSRVEGAGTLWRRALDGLLARAAFADAAYAGPSGLVPGDPVLRIEGDALIHCGRVDAVAAGPSGDVASLRLDPFTAERLRADGAAAAMHPDSNLGWTLRTLTPPELRDRVARELAAAWETEGESALAVAAPALKEGLLRLGDAVAAALPEAFSRDRATWAPLVERLRVEVFESELKPALDAALWPRVEAATGAAAAGLAEELVRELGLAALFRAAWARTKDAAGLGDERSFEKEMEETLRTQALPIVRRRAPEIAAAALRGAREGFDDPALRDALARAAGRIADDPEVRAALGRLARSVFLEDARVREAWRAMTVDPRLLDAAGRVRRAAEPIFEAAIRDALLRDDGQGLDLRLVRVLRNVLLWKDRRYVLLELGAGGALDGPLRGVRGG